LDLSDGVLIKSNHIALAGGAVLALERAIRNRRGRQPIEIEVRSLEEVQQALNLGADAILLDNVSVETVRKAVELCARQPVRIPLECAGGITLENVRSYAETGVDFISVGALTQPSTLVDMSLRVQPV
jgi:nicotinate-nucleotide pyrophosphorylase (carboxylating)